MPDKATLIKDLDWISERISNRVWAISVGVLAFCFAFLVEAAGAEASPFLAPSKVIPPIVLTLVSMICDLAQYVGGYNLNVRLLERLERERKDSLGFDHADPAFRFRLTAYWAKLGFCGLGVVWLIAVAAHRTIEIVTGA